MRAAHELTAADWHRLNGLLAQALALDEPARTDWLARLPKESVDLQPLLAQLLADVAPTELQGTSETLRPVVALAAAALAGMRHEQAGDRLGPWRLTRLIAEGGMGAVWEAERADGVMQRRAALKLPRAEWVDRGLAERIGRERAILARLAHPAIAVLYDAGLADGGRPYLALEYVDGVPIDAWCQGRELKEVLRLFVQVVRAVAYAHGQLVIHRDLKPANVLVTGAGLPKLLDFGISKLIEGETLAAEATALTRLAGRPLTLAYAAPEQLLNLPVTVAADVYALGVMLFELTSGQRLYRSAAARELEAEVLSGDLRLASAAASDKARAKALRGDLDAIVATALKRNAAERYDSATALADDLQRYLDGQPVRARPDSRAYRLRKFVARNRLPVAAATAVLIALGIGLGVALWQGNAAREQAARATALNTFILGLIRTADPNASRETKAADVALLNTIEQRIDTEFDGAPDQLLQLRVTVGDAYRNRGESPAAIRVYQRAIDEAAPRLSADDLNLLKARVRAADHALIVSEAASHSLDETIERLRKHGQAGADALIDALMSRHELAYFFGVPKTTPWDERFKTIDEALEVALRYFGPGSRQHLRVLPTHAFLIAVSGDESKSERMLSEALARAEARGDGAAQTAEYRDAQTQYAVWLCSNERAAEGLSRMWDIVEAVRAAHGQTSVQYERLVAALGDCYANTDDSTSLGPIEAYAVAAAREKPPSTTLMRRAEEAMGSAIGGRDYALADRFYQAAMDNARAIAEGPLRDRLTLRIRMERVCLLTLTGQLTEAERFAAPLVAQAEREYRETGRMKLGEAALWSCKVMLLREQRRYDEAVQLAQTYIARCQAMKLRHPMACMRGFSQKVLTQLDAGQVTAALAEMEALPLDKVLDNNPNLQLAWGRALLAGGRRSEALEPLRRAYGGSLAMATHRFPYAAELEYWLGVAWIANGERRRGERMVAEARSILGASPLPSHRALAARPAF